MGKLDLYAAVKRHHNLVAAKGYKCVMTTLIGSQNYGLDIESSDIDTFTFIFPSVEDLAFARAPVSGEFEVEDGKCMYKDIRLALNLLKKTSPNSVECFVGKCHFFEPDYFSILNKFLHNEEYMNYMVHCNYSHMLYACAGMAHQLTKRNMPAGKRYSHAIRLMDMVDTYLNSLDFRFLLEPLEIHLEEARSAKRDTRESMNDYYNKGCELIAQQLDETREKFVLTEYKEKVEQRGLELIEQLQKELLLEYIKKEVVNGN